MVTPIPTAASVGNLANGRLALPETESRFHLKIKRNNSLSVIPDSVVKFVDLFNGVPVRNTIKYNSICKCTDSFMLKSKILC